MRPRFEGGDPCLDSSLLLELCNRLRSSLAFDLLSPAARRCCLSAATSTSEGGTSAGELALRFPRASRERTIFSNNSNAEMSKRTQETQTKTRVRAN